MYIVLSTSSAVMPRPPFWSLATKAPGPWARKAPAPGLDQGRLG